MKGTWLRIFLLLIFVGGVAVAGGWWMLHGLSKEPLPVTPQSPMAAQTNTVSTPTQTQSTGENSINLSSIIEPFGALPVSSRVTANIVSLCVHDGAAVRKGQLLCVLDETELRQQIAVAQLDVVKANEALRNAMRKRDTSSQDKRLTLERAQQEISAARTQQPLEWQNAQNTLAQVQRALADLAASQPLELRNAQATLTRARQDLADYESLQHAKAVSLDEVKKKREVAEDAEHAVNLLSISQDATLRKQREAVENTQQALTLLQAFQQAKYTALLKAVEQVKLAGADEAVSGEDIQADQLACHNAQLELSAFQRRLADTRVLAPNSGTVRFIARTKTAEMAGAGESADKLGPGVRVYEGDPFLEISAEQGCCRIEVDETDIARLRLGMDATISGDAFPGKVLHGKIAVIQTSAHTAAQGISLFPITVEITSPLQGTRMGMTADVTIRLGDKEEHHE